MKKVMFLLVGLLFAASANAASVTYYNSLAAFEASHVSGSLEEFEDTTLNSGLTITSPNLNISGGVMNDILQAGTETVFEFGSSVNAFGGDWDLSPGGLGTGIKFTIQAFLGSTMVLAQELSANTFFGFITDANTLFNKVILSVGSACCQETYTLDNLRYGLHDLSQVPVPAALFLFAPALLGFFGLRRKAATAA